VGHGSSIDRRDAQGLWDVVRFKASSSKELHVSGPWGAFSFHPSPAITWDAASSPAVIVGVTERVSKALLGISSLSRLNLSPREVEACRWLLEGFAKPEIAERMRVAESTVRSSVKSIYTRLGVASREQLLDLALRSI
jgi:DNA-binding CsgD family transcriptional regulator